MTTLSKTKEWEGKTVQVEFVVDGTPWRTGFALIKDGEVSTEDVEESFYKVIRGLESFKKDAEEEEKEFLIDNLTYEQEEILKNAHAETYIGTDDDMPDAYESWLEDLDLSELKHYLND